MDMDDELRRAGAALDEASRRHRRGTWPSGDGRAAWLTIAAALLVVGVVIAGLLAFGRGRDETDAVIVPATGSAAETTVAITTPETTAVITTPETDPSTTDTTARSIQAIVHDDFTYYGACGNEVVEVFGTQFYPLLPEQVALLDLSIYPVFSPARSSSGFARPRVGPPGPGDDIGTMTVYSDGVARFESRSGIVIWLSDREQSYNWVC